MSRYKLPDYDSDSEDLKNDVDCTCYDLDVLSTDAEESDADLLEALKRNREASKAGKKSSHQHHHHYGSASKKKKKKKKHKKHKQYVVSSSDDDDASDAAGSSDDNHYVIEGKIDRVANLYERVRSAQKARLTDQERFQSKSHKTRKLIKDLMAQLKDAQATAERKQYVAEKLSEELHTTKQMEKLVKEQEKLLQRKQKELEAMDSRMKKQVRAYKQETTNAATVLRERYEREKLKRRLAEEDAEAVRAAVAREKTEMQQELEVAHDLEEIYKSELNRTRDQLNTSELLMEAKDKYESERDRLALQNMEDDVYRLKNQYEMEHLVNQAQEKLIHLKPYLGILFVSEPREGTLLQSVKTGHAAYLCGLRSRDVILAVNGHHTNNKAEFYAALFGLAPGDTFACTVHRAAEGGEKHFTVTMGSFNVPLPQVQALRRIVDHIYQPGTEQFNLNVQEARLSRHRPSSLKKGKRKKGKKKKVKKKKKASKLKNPPATREAWASVV